MRTYISVKFPDNAKPEERMMERQKIQEALGDGITRIDPMGGDCKEGHNVIGIVTNDGTTVVPYKRIREALEKLGLEADPTSYKHDPIV